jgi:hypothetical protein
MRIRLLVYYPAHVRNRRLPPTIATWPLRRLLYRIIAASIVDEQ